MRDLKDEKRPKLYAKQREKYCIADCDVWEFDHTLCHIIIRGVRQLKKYGHGYPGNLSGMKEWHDKLDQMEQAFTIHLKEIDLMEPITEDEKKKKAEGMQTFIEYFGSLWD